jgi:membrane-associated protease RseP (regulator of RpoE activity)
LTVGHNPDNYSIAFIGVETVGYSDLQSTVSTYTGSFLTRPILYLCIPTFTNCQGLVPFSSSLSPFYASSYGQSLVPLATGLYWFFFLNFNLAIFNALPIYPLDGGQTFRVGLMGATRGKLGEKWLSNVTMAVTLLVLVLVLSLPLSAYLGLI